MQMFYGVGIAHILYFCNASCRSVENVVIMVMMMMMMMTMMSSRRRRGYLRTVTFEPVYKTHHMLVYSQGWHLRVASGATTPGPTLEGAPHFRPMSFSSYILR